MHCFKKRRAAETTYGCVLDAVMKTANLKDPYEVPGMVKRTGLTQVLKCKVL